MDKKTNPKLTVFVHHLRTMISNPQPLTTSQSFNKIATTITPMKL